MKRRILFTLSMVISLLFCSLVANAEVYAMVNTSAGEVLYLGEENKNVVEVQASQDDLKSFKITPMQTQIIPITPIMANEDLVYHGEVLYRIKFQFTAIKMTGQPAVNYKIDRISYTSNGIIKGMKCTPTNSSGVGYLEIDVRGANNAAFTAYCRNLSANTSYTPKEIADYESSFYITYYITAKESDYAGVKVYPAGITDAQYKNDFLAAVKMNGSGLTDSGKYIRYDASTNKYTYHSPITSTQTTPTAERTIAVDNTKIPRYHVSGSTYKRGKVYIQGIGERIAEDSGGMIQAFHIDVYTGIGKSSMKYSVTNAKVTFRGTTLN